MDTSEARARRLKIVDVETAAEWRAWLAKHHDSEIDAWLVFHKRHTDRTSIAYEEAINEALCFGWIDSLIKRLDDARYARKCTPSKPGSRWSTANRKRYAQLQAQGQLMPSGLKLAPTGRSGNAPRPSLAKVPPYIQHAIDRHPGARDFFHSLAPSYQRMYVGWIDSAKKDDTKTRRLREAVDLLAAGMKPGLK